MKKLSMKQGAGRALVLTAIFVVAAGTGEAQQTQGGGSHTGHTGHQQAAADVPFDLHFIAMMTMHHEHGVEMAKLAEEKGENARVKAFAAKTRADQEKDITELRAMRERWYKDRPAGAGHAGMTGASHEEMQKKMELHMTELKANSGHGFDHQFVDFMAHHHTEGIAMAREATGKAEHAEVKTFAKTMIAKQGKEVGELDRLRAYLKGSHGHPPASPGKGSGVRKGTKPRAAARNNAGH